GAAGAAGDLRRLADDPPHPKGDALGPAGIRQPLPSRRHCLCPAMRSLCAGANTYSTGMSINPNGSEGWRVGVLFSRGGLSALTESEHLRGTILAIEEINR